MSRAAPCSGSRAPSPTAPCATAARSAARSVTPIRPRTGCRRCRRCGAKVTLRSARGASRSPRSRSSSPARSNPRLRPGEIVEAVRVPAMPASARWGYVKACRKIGEFAHAIAAVLIDPEQATARVVIGAVEARADRARRCGGAVRRRITGDFEQQFDAARGRRDPDQGRHGERRRPAHPCRGAAPRDRRGGVA